MHNPYLNEPQRFASPSATEKKEIAANNKEKRAQLEAKDWKTVSSLVEKLWGEFQRFSFTTIIGIVRSIIDAKKHTIENIGNRKYVSPEAVNDILTEGREKLTQMKKRG